MAFLTFILLPVSLLLATSSAAPKGTKYGITIPEGCKGKGFCHIKPDGYDEMEKKFKKILPSHMNTVDIRSNQTTELISEDDDNCPSITKEVSVYTIHDENPSNMDIVVQNTLISQKIMIKRCAHNVIENQIKERGMSDSQCFTNLGLSSFNLKTSCQESTAMRSLLVYDPEANLIKMKTYNLPVCCSCRITRL